MDVTSLQSLLQLLFGNLGALGTVFVMVSAYHGWLLKLEREEHAETRGHMKELNEKRLELHVENVRLLGELKRSLDDLTIELRSKRR